MKIITTLCGMATLCVVLLFAPFFTFAQVPSPCAGAPNGLQNSQQSFQKGYFSTDLSEKKDENNNQEGSGGGGGVVCAGYAASQTGWQYPYYGQRGCFLDVQNLQPASIKINSLNQAMFRSSSISSPVTVKVYRTTTANTFAGHQTTPSDWTLLLTTVISDLPIRGFGSSGALTPNYRLLTLPIPINLASGQSVGLYVVADQGTGGVPICCNTVGDGAISNTFTDGYIQVTGGDAESYGEFAGTFGINGIWMGEVNWTNPSNFAPPSSLSGAPISGAQASLSWSFNNGCASGSPDFAYVEYARKNGSSWLAWQTLPLPGAPNSAILTGLIATKTYRWRVRARYSLPTGPVFLISLPPYPQFTMPASLIGGGGDEKNGLIITEMLVAPNPSNGASSVFFPIESATNLRLYRLDGRLILEEKRAENLASGQFDLESLETGVYLITVTTLERVLTQKLWVD
jgi:Secretion system C-terminal sorting domain/Fibronectin type III domain